MGPAATQSQTLRQIIPTALKKMCASFYEDSPFVISSSEKYQSTTNCFGFKMWHLILWNTIWYLQSAPHCILQSIATSGYQKQMQNEKSKKIKNKVFKTFQEANQLHEPKHQDLTLETRSFLCSCKVVTIFIFIFNFKITKLQKKRNGHMLHLQRILFFNCIHFIVHRQPMNSVNRP